MTEASEPGEPTGGGDTLLPQPRGGARTWYEVLEVDEGASDAEVRKAYERALAIVEGRSIGGYLMLDPVAAESARADVEAAYAILGNAERRAAYDRGRLPAGAAEEGPRDTRAATDSASRANSGAGAEPAPAPPDAAPEVRRGEGDEALPRRHTPVKILSPVGDAPGPAAPGIRFDAPRTEQPTEPPTVQATVLPSAAMPAPPPAPPPPSTTGGPVVLPDGPIAGALIKEIRMGRGLSLEEVSEATKIRKPYLRAIEDEDLAGLPARVYLRGFLTQVARVLKVDRARLAEGYLQFVEQKGGAPKE